MNPVKRFYQLQMLVNFKVSENINLPILMKKIRWEEVMSIADYACMEAQCRFLDLAHDENQLSLLIGLKKPDLSSTLDQLEVEFNKKMKEMIQPLENHFVGGSFFEEIDFSSVDADGSTSLPKKSLFQRRDYQKDTAPS